MKVGIDISPIEGAHKVRGTGFYVRNLTSALVKYFNNNEYVFFKKGDKLPNDLDLIHYPYFEPFFLTLPIHYSIPTVVTVLDLTPLIFPIDFPAGIRGMIKWQIQKRRLKKSHTVITDSFCAKKDIVDVTGLNPSKISVTYLAAGEEYKRISNLRSQKLKMQEKYSLPDKFVFYAGDVTANKNLPRLLEACIQNNIPLVLAGKALVSQDYDKENPWNKDLVKVQKLSESSDLIRRVGFVPAEDLLALYNIATVFVLPSFYEGFGLPIAEAMACGCPVITTREGSLQEVAGNAAIYVDPYDVRDIRSGIQAVFNDKNLQNAMSKKGIIQSRKFSWKKTAEETINVYQKVFSVR